VDGRERVTRAIEFAQPDRLPIRHILLPGAMLHHGEALRALLERHPEDFAPTGYREPSEYGERIGVGQADAWGAVWVRESDEHKGLVVGHPLASWDDLNSYRFPDPLEAGDWSGVAETLGIGRRGRYVIVDGDTLFQRMFYLRGYEALMLDLGEGRPEAAYLRDRIVDVMLRKIGRWLDFPVDGFQFRDDWGTQQALMISPELWCRFYKPAYARLFGAVRSAGKHVFFHSDGQIEAIIPDLVEIGAQVLNPQVRVVGHELIAREYRGRVCFLGDVDRQYVLPFGSPDEVAAYTRREIAALASSDGGYIGCGELAADVPLANAEAMLREFSAYRFPRPDERRAEG
jgi:uroporphyrinogen decarboxylase